MAHLEVDTQDGITLLTMNRPDARNALSLEMRAALKDALHDIEADDAVRCVVLRGAGSHFMAGGDIKSMAEIVQKEPEERRKQFVLRIHDLHPVMFAMRRMPKPILASVRGAAATSRGSSTAPSRTSSNRSSSSRASSSPTALPARTSRKVSPRSSRSASRSSPAARGLSQQPPSAPARRLASTHQSPASPAALRARDAGGLRPRPAPPA